MNAIRSGVEPRIHPTADISPQAFIGEGTRIWHEAQVRERARIGCNCILGKGVYIDFGVEVGNNCKLQNGAYVYHGAKLEDGVFIGPRAMLLNDRYPRAVIPDDVIDGRDRFSHSGGCTNFVAGAPKTDADWQVGPIRVGEGASIGAGAIVLPGVAIGRWAMVAAGAIVTSDVPDYGLVYGNPARLRGFVCPCGRQLTSDDRHPATPRVTQGEEGNSPMVCAACGREILVSSGSKPKTLGPRPPQGPTGTEP